MKRINNGNFTNKKSFKIEHSKTIIAQFSYKEECYMNKCVEFRDLYSKPEIFPKYINDLNFKLKDLSNQFQIHDKQTLVPIPKELNTIAFPFNIPTYDRVTENNFKSLFYIKLTIDSLKGKQNLCSYDYTDFRYTQLEIQKAYDLSYKLNLTKFFAELNHNLIPYLYNESGQFRSYEMIQMIGAVQKLDETGVEAHSKTESGPGDMYVHENGSYVLLDLKSADLSNDDLRKLLIKTIKNYSRYEKSYICLNGDENALRAFIEQEQLKIPANIKLIFINTHELFKNSGFYGFDQIKTLLLDKLYSKISHVGFKKTFYHLITKNVDKVHNTINLISLEQDLDEFYPFYDFITCQTVGDNFFDSGVLADLKEFNLGIDEDNNIDGGDN